MEGNIKPWEFKTENIAMDQKGKIQFLHPELRGPAQCPFWKTLKSKIAANLKEGLDDVKVPKSFAIEVGKEYKVPLDPTYTTPMCIGAKICAHFRGVGKGTINCDFKLGKDCCSKSGPEKKVDVASTTEPVPEENKVEAPVKEEVGERGSVPAVSEAKKCPKCGKPQKENTEGDDRYCQGHSILDNKVEERTAATSATPLVGLTDAIPENYPENEDIESTPGANLNDKQKDFVEKVEADGLEVYYDYSGRGMFGRRCPAVNVDSLSELSFNPNKYSVDNMGKGFVVYCP